MLDGLLSLTPLMDLPVWMRLPDAEAGCMACPKESYCSGASYWTAWGLICGVNHRELLRLLCFSSQQFLIKYGPK
jgi:hypothetical protein